MSYNRSFLSRTGHLDSAREQWHDLRIGGRSPRAFAHEAKASLSASVSDFLKPKPPSPSHSPTFSTFHDFDYSSLDLEEGQIRVVRILPSDDSKLKCEMKVASLDDPPEFIALSYVWGSEFAPRSIQVNGRPMCVRRNLYNFLCQARDQPIERDLWIDALCINQNNIPERNHQVRQMKHVYESAESVVTWLGRSDAKVAKLFKMVASDEVPELAKDVKTLHKVLYTISELDYWSRLWIVPEFILAHDVYLMYGGEVVSWKAFQECLRVALNTKDPDEMHEKDALRLAELSQFYLNWRSARSQEAVSKQTIQSLVRTYGLKGCSDKRDRIFALHALATNQDLMQVDYNDPKEVVMLRLLRASNCKGMDIFDFAKYLMKVLEISPKHISHNDEHLDTIISRLNEKLDYTILMKKVVAKNSHDQHPTTSLEAFFSESHLDRAISALSDHFDRALSPKPSSSTSDPALRHRNTSQSSLTSDSDIETLASLILSHSRDTNSTLSGPFKSSPSSSTSTFSKPPQSAPIYRFLHISGTHTYTILTPTFTKTHWKLLGLATTTAEHITARGHPSYIRLIDCKVRVLTSRVGFVERRESHHETARGVEYTPHFGSFAAFVEFLDVITGIGEEGAGPEEGMTPLDVALQRGVPWKT